MAQKIQRLSFSKTESPAEINEGSGWDTEHAAEWCRQNDFPEELSEDIESGDLLCTCVPDELVVPETQETTTENYPTGVIATTCSVTENASAEVSEKTEQPLEQPAVQEDPQRRSFKRSAPTGPQHKAAALGIEDEENRIVSFIASDETVDRMGDIIRARGWVLNNFKKNPVLLWAHNSSEPPIGVVTDVRVQDDRLIARAKFMPVGLHDFADKIWRMVQLGFLRAVSVGFLPKEYEPRRGNDGEFLGYEFLKQELLELSVVPVPANPAALTVARSAGMDVKTLSRLFEPTPESKARVRAAHSVARNRLRLVQLGVSGIRNHPTL